MQRAREDDHGRDMCGGTLLVGALRLPEDDAGGPDADKVAKSEKGKKRHASGVRGVGLKCALL